MKKLFAICVSIVLIMGGISDVEGHCQSTQPATTSQSDGKLAKSRFLSLASIKGGTLDLFQWRPGVNNEAAHPEIDFTRLIPVMEGLFEEDIEEYFPLHHFDINNNGKILQIDGLRNRTSLDYVQFEGVKGIYKVEWKDTYPVRFILDPSMEDRYDEGLMSGSTQPKYGFEWFTVSYGSDGLPSAMDGKLTQKFGGDYYSEIYTDYEFDKYGNWIRRTVIQRFGAGSDARKVSVKEYRQCLY